MESLWEATKDGQLHNDTEPQPAPERSPGVQRPVSQLTPEMRGPTRWIDNMSVRIQNQIQKVPLIGEAH